MFKISEDKLRRYRAQLLALDSEFDEWRPQYQDLAKYILPRKYEWLVKNASRGGGLSATENGGGLAVNSAPSAARSQPNFILDATGTEAARTLSHGLRNGATSRYRPWFTLRLQNFPETEEGYPIPVETWLEDTRDRLMTIMAESNFYNALGVQYTDLSVFGTACLIIYEDFNDVIRCYNSPVGEFRVIQDDRRMGIGLARTFELQIHQIVSMFGLDNCSPKVQRMFKAGGAQKSQTLPIHHLILPNEPEIPVDDRYEYAEMYWEVGRSDGALLRLSGFTEKAHLTPRWDLTGNDTYGSSPAWDALPDIKQLQHAVKQKMQAVDKMNRPPLVADAALQTNPTAFLPGQVSYVPGSSSIGARPVYTVNPPLGEMNQDIMRLQDAIRRHFYNNLFRNVSNLQTVRSAAEVYERKAEDMVMLGPVLERFENEALDPAINRIFRIAQRKGLLLDPPPEIAEQVLEVKYVSILADAQRNVGSASTERAWQTLGNIGSIKPEILDILDWDESVRHYFKQVGTPARTIRSRDDVEADRQERAAAEQAQAGAQIGNDLTQAAKNLADTDLGGGANALQQLTGL